MKLGKHFRLSQLARTNIATNRVKLNITKSLFLVLIDDSTKQKDKWDAVSLKVTVYFFWFYRRVRNCFIYFFDIILICPPTRKWNRINIFHIEKTKKSQISTRNLTTASRSTPLVFFAMFRKALWITPQIIYLFFVSAALLFFRVSFFCRSVPPGNVKFQTIATIASNDDQRSR